MTNNHTVVSLKKVQHATFYYRNQFGETTRRLPKGPSVHGRVVSATKKSAHLDTTELALAKELGLLDRWTAVLKLELSANHRLTYTGDKATSLWNAWNTMIFGT